MGNKDNIMGFVNKLNERAEMEIFDVPVIDGFEIQNNSNFNVVFVAAAKDNSIEQLVCDGVLEEDETFIERLNKVLNETIQNGIENGLESPKENSFFYKDYINKFSFKIYIHDFIKSVGEQKRVIRQISAYFVEPIHNRFYQLSLSTAPFAMPTEILKLGKDIDLENDLVTKNLITTMEKILEGIKYIDK